MFSLKKCSLWLLSFLLSTPLWAQQVQLRGTVKDETGEALPGATVQLLQSDKGQASDANGAFRLTLTRALDTLKVSYVGYNAYQQVVHSADGDQNLTIRLTPETKITDEVIFSATRANEKTPTTHTQIDREALEKQNTGQDMPYLLNMTPSMVVTSDAGAGVGYTGMRIRGTDSKGINTTINGIPLNEGESHGVYWVDLPDFASSVDNIQIQRGVGSSTNGAGAFGATINIQTTTLHKAPYASLDNSYGSFNTRKHTFSAGSGLLKKHFAFDARISSLYSDGYVDRAFSDLFSYYLSGGYYGKHSILRFNFFSGKEKTYQSWYGVTQGQMDTISRTYNPYTYDNQTDNYWQDHYQLIYANDLSKNLTLNAALHYTKGKGYYENYESGESFAAYGLPDVTIGDSTLTSTDLINRRWLNNDFYGTTFSLDYDTHQKLHLILGGAWSQYYGGHYGEIIWSEIAVNAPIRKKYYDNDALKTDFNAYGKAYWELMPKLNAYLDLQYRQIGYRYHGIDNDQSAIKGDYEYHFFNPKGGLSYKLDGNSRLYASYAVAHREPVRSDFLDNVNPPKAEELGDLELGYSYATRQMSFHANYYWMQYKDQLVMTGKLNDVGSPIRTNVPDSYRTGIELQGEYHTDWIALNANAAFSQNKIKNFQEVIYTYDGNYTQLANYTLTNEYDKTDISFSPDVVAGASVTLLPDYEVNLTFQSKYVGKQYLDNTANDNRALDPYWVNDVRLTYALPLKKWVKSANLILQVNNVLNTKYESNGYVFTERYASSNGNGGYNLSKPVAYNYYYPQAGINYMLALHLKF